MSKQPNLVIGATGTIGSELVKQLADTDESCTENISRRLAN
jgi:uncharacterized protein YbjT (DUF2867 family)